MSKRDIEELKLQAIQELERQRGKLIELSRRIHANPELGFEEFKAAQWLTENLEQNGFSVQRGICGLATAFRASYGSGKPAIAILAEYDALPRLGHACGHNIIATSAIGAAVAARQAIDQAGGNLLVIGTPAEEMKGGKVIMANKGAFDDLDIAMLVHPDTRNSVIVEALACAGLEVEFLGKAAHAAAQPQAGINALEALIMSFNAINSLRQHIKPDARIHGIITDGGEAANIVPAHSAASFLVRAKDLSYLEELKTKVLDCFVAGAVATRAELRYRWAEEWYAPLRTNLTLAQTFAANLEKLGRKVHPGDVHSLGSTDMGNVSQIVPSVHPMIAIAAEDVQVHSPEFAAAAASEAGHQGMLDAAKALAMTVVDLVARPELVARIRDEFRAGAEKPR